MKYGFCNIGIIPIRREPSECSEMVTQLLFGDVFEVLEEKESWVRIRNQDDEYEGWMDSKQAIEISHGDFYFYNIRSKNYIREAIAYVFQSKEGSDDKSIFPIYFGSQVIGAEFVLGGIRFEISPSSITSNVVANKVRLSAIAIKYLFAPYLWGGKSMFGLDCSGFSQICFKQIGINLPRDASQQVEIGEEIENINDAISGDLMFFEDSNQKITHVGIYLGNCEIIHSSGYVRIDRVDSKGIYIDDKSEYTHNLAKIKRIF